MCHVYCCATIKGKLTKLNSILVCQKFKDLANNRQKVKVNDNCPPNVNKIHGSYIKVPNKLTDQTVGGVNLHQPVMRNKKIKPTITARIKTAVSPEKTK